MTTNGRASCARALPDLGRSPAARAHFLNMGVGGGVESLAGLLNIHERGASVA